jgi:hypothetical protein
MVGPRDFSSAELYRCGLGKIQRRNPNGPPLMRMYCLRCGSQVFPDRRGVDPDGWWACVRGCNTLYAVAMGVPPGRPTT